jgi:putative transposase
VADYRRSRVDGGTYFLSLITLHRHPRFADPAMVQVLRGVLRSVQTELPFQIDAAVVLPDHVHFLLTLPRGDDDYPRRITIQKRRFSQAIGAPRSTEPRKRKRREMTIWQRRYWEHTIQDPTEFERFADYIHYNPVKHGHATCPHQWEWSSFKRWVERGWRPLDWACRCHGKPVPPILESDFPNGGE